MKIRCVVNTVFNQLGSQTTEKSLPVWMIFSVVCLLTVFPRSDADAESSSSRGSLLSPLLWTVDQHPRCDGSPLSVEDKT